MRNSTTSSVGLIFFVCLLVGGACQKKNLIKQAEPIDSIVVGDIPFQHLSARINLSFELPDQQGKAKAHLRMQRDSIIWLSIGSSMGIEVLRIQITPESIWVVNRDKRTYATYNFEQLSQQLGFPLSFGLLQALLLGEMPFKQAAQQYGSYQEDQHYIVHQQVHNLHVENQINLKTRRMQRLTVKDEQTTNHLSIDYQDYVLLNATPFPQYIKAELKGQPENRANALVEYQKVEIMEGPQKIPFNIPSTYQKIE